MDRSGNEPPQTDVIISRGFWMGKYEVTQGDYLAVMGINPSYFQPPNTSRNTNRPVDSVRWYDAKEYCARLTEREQLAGRIAPNSIYRLPTEAEWEYACRAWTSTRFNYGDDPGYTNLTYYAWHGGEWETHAVGQKLPNSWGLYDMPGNVIEWCQDWFGDSAGGIALDPQGPTSGFSRVLRGGYRFIPGRYCRSAFRFLSSPGDRSDLYGFRMVLAPTGVTP